MNALRITHPARLLLAGVAFPPVAGNGIAGAGEPLFVAAELFQRFRGEELRAIAGGMTERFQQAGRYESGNLAAQNRETTPPGSRPAVRQQTSN